MLQIVRLDSRDPFPVVFDLGPWLDQCVEHDVAVEVDDRHSGKPVTFLGQDALAVQGKNLGLPILLISVKICLKLEFKFFVDVGLKLTCHA